MATVKDGLLSSLGQSPQVWSFTPSIGWSPTNPRMVTHQKEEYYSLEIWFLDLTKKTKTRWKLRWIGSSPTKPRMVTHQPKDGHPLKGSVLHTWNSTLRLNSHNYSQVATAMDGHLLFLGWSPTNPRMVTHQKELLYTLEIRHLDITHQTKARWQVPWMVTYHA